MPKEFVEKVVNMSSSTNTGVVTTTTQVTQPSTTQPNTQSVTIETS